MTTEVITEYPFPDVRDNFPALKLIDRTGKGFTIKHSTDFVARHARDDRLRTAYSIQLGEKDLTKYGSPFRICNTIELTIEGGYTSKKGNSGYLLTEKDDGGTNTYFADAGTLEVTTIQGELVHFMYEQQSSFANERVKENDEGKVESVGYTQTRPLRGCCGSC